MKSDSGKVLFFILFLTLSAMTVVAGTIKGTVTDKQTREPLTGATIQIAGTTQGSKRSRYRRTRWCRIPYACKAFPKGTGKN